MKKVCLVLIVLLCCATSYAQQHVATLAHNGNVSIFYGVDAFKDAYNAAVSGDVICLSVGHFNRVDEIKKSITLRGSGCRGGQSTVIRDGIYVRIPSNETSTPLKIEGIKFTNVFCIDCVMQNPLFANCYFESLQFQNVFNGTLTNCFIGSSSGNSQSTIWSVNFVNCVVGNICEQRNMNFVNCLVGKCRNNNGCEFTNCIMRFDEYGGLDYTVKANNCVGIVNSYTAFQNCSGSNNTIASDIFVNNVISGWYIANNDTLSYELTPAAQTQYLGTDGTQVGIYGGMNPYTGLFSYPVINRMQVANKSTDDGQLNVEVEVTPAH
ncbi:MAG: hypothetical protein MJ002_08785 [Paludibacteraceae bacterium]|nr:hypothetical protein [Paludibacteraceae bacterium]